MHWIIKALLFAAFVYSLPGIIRIIDESGFRIRRIDHSPGPCRVVPDVKCGSEDIALMSNGLAFISSGLRSVAACHKSDVKGALYLFDFQKPDNNVSKLDIISDSIDFDKFEPHGVGLFEGKSSSEARLFVVDHSLSIEVIRIFSYNVNEKYILRHVDTISDATFECLNDVAPTGPRQFYTTNYVRYCKGSVLKNAFGDIMAFLLKHANVVFFDGTVGRIVAGGLKLANGVSLSADGKVVYVASTTSHEIVVYNRSPENGNLERSTSISVQSHPDNIFVDTHTGDLYVGAHPYVVPTMLKDYNGSRPAPAQVLKIRNTAGDWSSYETTELLYNSGLNFVRGCSVGVFYENQLLIGTMNHKLGYCRVSVAK